MNEDKWSKNIILICGISIFITILIYFIVLKNIFKFPMGILSLFFVIISEIATFYIIAKTKKEVLRISIITVSIGYLILTLILAFIFINFLMIFFRLYIITNIVLIGISVILIVVLNKFSDRINMENNKVLSAQGIMFECESKIELYLSDTNYSKYREQLNKIYEEIKYSDISSECGIEGKILQKIEGISISNENLSEYLNELSFLIKERDVKMKNIKKGLI